MKYASLITRWRIAAHPTRPLHNQCRIRSRSYKAWEQYGRIAEELLERSDGTLYRKRGHGQRSLPVPPMLDTEHQAARTRHKQPKQMTEVKSGSFEEELSRNLFASAITTPLRYCGYTRTRLPAHFLICFENRLDRQPSLDDASPGRAKARLELAGTDACTTGEKFGGNSWMTLSHDCVSRCASAKSKGWNNLHRQSDRSLMNKLTVGYQTEWDVQFMDKLPSALMDILNEAVRSALKNVLAQEHLVVTAGENHDRLLDVGMLITVGGQNLHAETLVNGIEYFVWNEHISPETDMVGKDLGEAQSQTYGIVHSKELVALFSALDRRFAYSNAYKQKDDAVRTASMEALLEFFRSMQQEVDD